MSLLKLEELLSFSTGGLKLHIFNSRCNMGLVAIMVAETDHAVAIEECFYGSDNDCAAVRSSLEKLRWFPIVFVESIPEAISGLSEKIQEGLNKKSPEWLIRHIELVGELIMKGGVEELPAHAEELATLEEQKCSWLLKTLIPY